MLNDLLRNTKAKRARSTFACLGTGLVTVALFVLPTVGCSHTTPVLGQGYELDNVHLEGVKRFGKSTLLDHLFSGEHSWVPFTPEYPYDSALQAADRERIAELYRAYGYHDAEVTTMRAEIRHDDKEVDLYITVDEGRPSVVREVDVQWAADSEVPPEVRERVLKYMGLVDGEPFEVNKLNESAGTMQMALLLEGYPHARVRGSGHVNPQLYAAKASFEIDPGPYAIISAIRYEGLVEVPKYMVDRESRFALGQQYSPVVIAQLESALKAMRVFRWISTLRPDKVVDGQVELVMRLSEADPESVRLGLQLTVETVRWQEQLRMDYTHTNIFGHLTRLDLTLVGGWAELPNPWAPEQHGPVARFTMLFTKKGLGEDLLLWTLRPSVELEIQEGYQFYSPNNRLGVSRWLGQKVSLGLSHNFRFVDFFNMSPSLDPEENTALGRDFADPFKLSSFDVQARVYLTNSISEPTDGVILSLDYAFSNKYLGSDYDFNQLTIGALALWKPAAWLQIAFRLKTGMILTYGTEQPGSPFSHKFYLGGSGDVRGWGSRRIAPRIEECDDNGENCEEIPIGGSTMLLGNLELRFHLVWKLYLVAFADMGDVQDGEATYKPEEWNYTAGGGLRVDTPLGRVRLDFGYRLNDPGVFVEDRPWAIHFGFGEAF